MKATLISLITLMLLGSGFAYAANEYTNSAHGNTSTGVNSSSRGDPPTSAYATGNCAHCHLYQHQSLDGVASGTVLSPQARSDIVPFCLECHETVQDDSAIITWNSGIIDDNDIHGDRNITNTVSLKDLGGINVGDITEVDGNYSISCIVCHEPHGTSNPYMIQTDVNATDTSGIPSWTKLCEACHDYTCPETLHHYTDPVIYEREKCGDCHSGSGSPKPPIDCIRCHYHGGTDDWIKAQQKLYPLF